MKTRWNNRNAGGRKRMVISEPCAVAAIAMVALTLSSSSLTAHAFATTTVGISTFGVSQAGSNTNGRFATALKYTENGDNEAPLNGSSNTDDQKLTIELVDDQNRHELLNPLSSNPVLVDAFAPWCGPCKLLDKVLRKAQPRYLQKVDFCRWNVNDKEGTAELKAFFLQRGFTLTKLPSLIVFREGEPVAVRPGFANEFQLDDFLEKTLPDVLDRTFDENGVKIVPLPSVNGEVSVVTHKISVQAEIITKSEGGRLEQEVALAAAAEMVLEEDGALTECITEEECFEKLLWENRTVAPAMDGILLRRP